jgi:nitronate monooxygenase
MNKAAQLQARMSIPVIVAPMFLISGVELVAACCKEGLLGTFPALNGHTTEDFERLLIAITDQLDSFRRENPEAVIAPYGVNLILHRSNPRIEDDLERCIRFKVPVIITSLGKPGEVVERVHAYGGLVFADTATVEHARKSADAGVDGLVLICAGAGGHAGMVNPLVFVPAVREFFDGMVAVAGGISDGRAVRACQVLGADFAYLGTRFIPTRECDASPAYKEMILAAQVSDIIYTPAVSGVPANFIRASLERCGFDVTKQGVIKRQLDLTDEYSLWRDIWTAGQGVQNIHEIASVRDVAQTLRTEYAQAKSTLG